MGRPCRNDGCGQTFAPVRKATTETKGNINQEKLSWLNY